MRTTLTLDDDVAEQLATLRLKRGVRLKTLVNDALRRGLATRKTPSLRGKNVRTRAFDAGTPLIPSLDDIAEVIALGDDEQFR